MFIAKKDNLLQEKGNAETLMGFLKKKKKCSP
jgi:hypothetical protein